MLEIERRQPILKSLQKEVGKKCRPYEVMTEDSFEFPAFTVSLDVSRNNTVLFQRPQVS